MKPPRSALPLPRYVERKPLKSGGWGYFFHVPSWARKVGCTVQSGAARHRLCGAVSRAEDRSLTGLRYWRTGGVVAPVIAASAAAGTLDWMFAEYRADRRFTKLDPKTKRNHESRFQAGRRLRPEGRQATRPSNAWHSSPPP